MKCEKLFAYIDQRKQDYVDIWENLVNLESPTAYKDGVDAAGRYLATLARALGFRVEIFPQERAGDLLCITMNPDAHASPVVFSGHIDTVHPVGSFGTPAAARKDGRLYGPGVADCKGGVVAALAAMHALRDVGFTARPVRLIVQTDEETNSRESNQNTLKIMVEKAKGAIAFLNVEATRGHSAVMTRKGIVRFRFTVHGTAVHASKCPEGVSAIAEAAHKILEIEKWKDIDAVTACCSTVSGGTAENAVPDLCTFCVDVRFFNNDQLETVRRAMQRIASTSYVGGTATIDETSLRPPMADTEYNRALLARMNRVYEQNGMPTLTARMSLGGSDASYTTDAGIPTVDSIGVDGDRVHTPHEYAYIDSLDEATKRLAAVAYCIEDEERTKTS